MDPSEFAADLARKPEALRGLAATLDRSNPWQEALGGRSDRVGDVVLLGMGSSKYAADVVAGRLRALGVPASAEFASNGTLPRIGDRTLVVAVSATGGSRETLDAVDRLRGQGTHVALTNDPESALAGRCDAVVAMDAGPEVGGVACRTFQHTVILLLALVDELCGTRRRPAELVSAAADASEHLLATEDQWLPDVTRLLIGPAGAHIAAPAERLSSAQQSALMLREGPRVAATGCETGDWSHVDVYLTKTTDYRLLLYGGSRWEDELVGWTTQRGTTVVSVGQDLPSAAYNLRYPGDGDPEVALLSEVLVAELVAARLWQATV